MKARVVVLTRDPLPGRVKTRLIPALGAEGAARLHHAMALATVEAAVRSGLPVEVALEGDLRGPFALELAARGGRILPQGGGDLGRRLQLAMSGEGRAIALGTDCPHLDPDWLLSAAGAPTPIAIGPSEDGGYWTIALDEGGLGVLEGIPWSTPQVLERSLIRAAALGLAHTLLPTCYDIDLPSDLARLRADPRCPPSLLPLLG